jgi:hypothetical protein
MRRVLGLQSVNVVAFDRAVKVIENSGHVGAALNVLEAQFATSAENERPAAAGLYGVFPKCGTRH